MRFILRTSPFVAVGAMVLLTSCGSGAPTQTPTVAAKATDTKIAKAGGWRVEKMAALSGFDAPESATPDLATGNVYVSVMVPKKTPDGPDYWTDDDDGFISRLIGDKLESPKWSTATDTVRFNSPKGLCVLKGELWVADVHQVLTVDLTTAKPSLRLKPPGAQMLNDMATDGESAFVSDTGTGKITRIGPKETSELQGPKGANGLAFRDGKLFCVSWSEHELYEIDLSGKLPAKPAGLAAQFKNCDGLEVLPDGSFLVADCTANRIARVSADLKSVETFVETPMPADVGLDIKRERLYVPSFEHNNVTVFRVWKE